MKKTSDKLQQQAFFLTVARDFPVWQNVMIATAGWFCFFSIANDIHIVMEWDFNNKPAAALGYFLAFCFYAVCIFPPAFAIYSVGIDLYEKLKQREKDSTLLTKLSCYVALIAFGSIILLGLFVVIGSIEKAFYPVSLFPFVATVNALFWLGIGHSLFSQRVSARHSAFLALMVIIILSGKYIDFDSRKPFLRDLYTVKVGMTGTDVKNIMGKYDEQVTHYAPLTYDYLQSDFTGEEIFRHTDEGWGDADWGIVNFQDGRVVKVEFSHD